MPERRRMLLTRRQKILLKRLTIYFFLLVIVAAFFVPVYWIFTTSFKLPKDILTVPPKFWFKPVITNYQVVLLGREDLIVVPRFNPPKDFSKTWLNSLIISTGSTILAVLLGTPAAYGLARFNFHGKKTMAYFIISLRATPIMGIIIPYYMIMSRYYLTDTHIGLMMAYLALNLSFVVWMMTNFFKEIPVDLEDAARVDGCSWLGAFIRVILPLSVTGLAASIIFSFILCWNEFLFALVLTNVEAKTVTVGVYNYVGFKAVIWGCLTAAAVLSILPVVIMVLFVQKHLVRGLLAGAIKR